VDFQLLTVDYLIIVVLNFINYLIIKGL